jgi:hypothetical protein
VEISNGDRRMSTSGRKKPFSLNMLSELDLLAAWLPPNFIKEQLIKSILITAKQVELRKT